MGGFIAPGKEQEGERGNSVVGFVLTAPLVLLVFLMLASIALAFHVHSIMVDAAAEGASYGSHVRGGVEAAERRTRELLDANLAGYYADGIDARITTVDGVAVMEVQVEGSFPLAGFAGPTVMKAHAHAPIE